MTRNPTFAQLFALVREHLWVPDGRCPEGWGDRREGSVLKQLLARYHASEIEVAILGLAQLRDRGLIDWLKPGQKVTCRALYHTRSGVCQMFELATQEYWRTAKRTAKDKKPKALEALGAILNEAMRRGAA